MGILDEYLDLESLLSKLNGKIKSQWYHFGLAIGVPNQTLDQLYNYSEDDCLVEVLDYWLKNHPDQPTWKELADAVADLQDYELANSILKVYSGRGKIHTIIVISQTSNRRTSEIGTVYNRPLYKGHCSRFQIFITLQYIRSLHYTGQNN